MAFTRKQVKVLSNPLGRGEGGREPAGQAQDSIPPTSSASTPGPQGSRAVDLSTTTTVRFSSFTHQTARTLEMTQQIKPSPAHTRKPPASALRGVEALVGLIMASCNDDDLEPTVANGCRESFDFTLIFEQKHLIGPSLVCLIFVPVRLLRGFARRGTFVSAPTFKQLLRTTPLLAYLAL